ncbi:MULTISPECIES: hypothetical protein [Novosphingobium]|uniref:hypothetical protein n=1 Tax=Novosphingobium TaxID=165696 RepID=UPI0022F27878|nr:hypothetical protein [Novosphingobium resinovorum]GLK43790.1 hypothetical protein GCM10017612_17090 [Novosphingobium resinovorum]
MKIAGFLFAGFLILAAFQAALTVLTYFIIGSIVIGLITRPWETIGMLTAIVVLGLVSRYPLPGALLLLAVCIVAAMAKAESRTPLR